MNIPLKIFALLGIGLAIVGVADAQSLHRERLDARAARRDMARVQADLNQARADRNWGKIAQDRRLIAADQRDIRSDLHKADRSNIRSR